MRLVSEHTSVPILEVVITKFGSEDDKGWIEVSDIQGPVQKEK